MEDSGSPQKPLSMRLTTPTVMDLNQDIESQIPNATVINVNPEASVSTTSLDQVDLNIENIEKSPRSTRSGHRATASMSDLPSVRGMHSNHSRQFSLDLQIPGGYRDYATQEAERERKRKAQERTFKIVVVVLIILVVSFISILMMAWEFGYFNRDGYFSQPVFY